MNIGLISSRYALALFEFAQQKKVDELIYDQVKLLVKTFSQYADLKLALSNPVLENEKKKQIINMSMGGLLHPVIDKFIDLLLENNRENELQSIALKYLELYRERKCIYSGKLTTAIKVDSQTEESLISLIRKETHAKLEIEKIVNPEILGGFVLEVDNVRWDASVLGQLKNIRKGFVEQNKKVIN